MVGERKNKTTEDGVKIQLVSVRLLKGAAWNPRTISRQKMDELKASIESDPDMLWERPILAQWDGTVYAGNQRLQACIELRWEAVPAVMEKVTDDVARARAIRDNNSWGEWDDAALAQYLQEVVSTDTEASDDRIASASVGFDVLDVEALLKRMAEVPAPAAITPDDDADATYVTRDESERGKTPKEMIEGWTEGQVRNVILYLQQTDHDEMSGLLDEIREHLDVETNAEAVATILEEAYADHSAKGTAAESG